MPTVTLHLHCNGTLTIQFPNFGTYLTAVRVLKEDLRTVDDAEGHRHKGALYSWWQTHQRLDLYDSPLLPRLLGLVTSYLAGLTGTTFTFQVDGSDSVAAITAQLRRQLPQLVAIG